MTKLISKSAACLRFAKEALMEKRKLIIRFNNPQEMVDVTIRMELKYFIAKLMYSHASSVL